MQIYVQRAGVSNVPDKACALTFITREVLKRPSNKYFIKRSWYAEVAYSCKTID